jgi:hypothetical protein
LNKKIVILLIFSFLIIRISYSQRQTNIWYFGEYAGLDFNSGIPIPLTDGVLSRWEGVATMSDSLGNLLFYTKGDTIWNRLHQVMANGTGLFGNSNFTQSSIILKQPGSNSLYYVFTLQGQNQFSDLSYSIVDMTAAAGMGSVTVKNYTVYSGPYSEKLTATKHCNGIDYWVILANSTSIPFPGSTWETFSVFKLTAAGFNTVAVVSTITTQTLVISGQAGAMKVSPNGKKIGLATFSLSSNNFQVLDFDNSSGQVSNPLLLGNGGSNGYGCEFSSNSTKFYGSSYGSVESLVQWDLSLGSNSAIISSQTVLGSVWGALQLALDGKIYCAQAGSQFLGVINNPNFAGNLCNFVSNGQSLGSSFSSLGLPNFAGNAFNTAPLLNFTTNGTFTICKGQTKTLTVSGATSYTWNGAITGQSLVISPNATSTYSVVGTTTTGCIFKASVTVTVSDCVGLIENNLTGFSVYPNPANDFLKIQLPNYESGESVRVQIYNSIGHLVFETELSISDKEEAINISEFENGVYFIKLIDKQNKILVKKLVVSK